MPTRAVSFAFPPFTRTVKLLIGINVAVYFLLLLMGVAQQGAAVLSIYGTFGLIPSLVVRHFYLWQVITYSFLHGGLLHILFNMLSLWMFGAALDSHWGKRQFLEFYFFCVIGAAVTTIVIAYAAPGVLGLRPDTLTYGASGGIFGILLAFAWYFGEQEIFMFPLPVAIKAKYMVAILILIALASAMSNAGGTAYIAHLGGALFGFLYLKFLPRRGLTFAFSEGYYTVRNSYHRWKRRRAQKRFQVYMRKHQHDPKEYFDEYGNFRPPDDGEKKDRVVG
ncbi:MAG TPA: rhomboid family intramembrane serine protease, partial [Candidatus Angelobacter sp.]